MDSGKEADALAETLANQIYIYMFYNDENRHPNFTKTKKCITSALITDAQINFLQSF